MDHITAALLLISLCALGVMTATSAAWYIVNEIAHDAFHGQNNPPLAIFALGVLAATYCGLMLKHQPKD